MRRLNKNLLPITEIFICGFCSSQNVVELTCQDCQTTMATPPSQLKLKGAKQYDVRSKDSS